MHGHAPSNLSVETECIYPGDGDSLQFYKDRIHSTFCKDAPCTVLMSACAPSPYKTIA
jgi:hypothetical protein